MATASRIRAFQRLSSRTLELLCTDLLFERQVATPASVPVWCPVSELPF